jgi:hypothetical protein
MVLLFISIASFSGILIYLLLHKLTDNHLERFKALRKGKKPVKQKSKEEAFKDKVTLGFMLGGAFLLGLITFRSQFFTLSLPIGISIGFITSKFFNKTIMATKRLAKLKDISLLYESVDLFTKAGFNIKQSLQISKILVPSISENINQCINDWPSGPLKAIERFGSEINKDLPEADVLTGLLMQAEECGTCNISGIMEQEALRLSELRKMAAESKIAVGPIFSTIYMFLPVASILGVILTPIAYQAIKMITDLRAG